MVACVLVAKAGKWVDGVRLAVAAFEACSKGPQEAAYIQQLNSSS